MSGSECPCGTGRDFDQCCGPALADTVPAPTAEALMRSRYTAFARGDAEHLRRSWAPETRPTELRLRSGQRWVGLEILDTVEGRELAATGVVEFRARHETDGVVGVLHERSRFRRELGRWVYVDGSAPS